MSISENKSHKIYYRPLHKWLDVSEEDKQQWERFINTTRKAQQRAGACCIPFKKSYQCDGLCEECEYRCMPEDAPKYFSVEAELENALEGGTSRDSFLASDALTTEIDADRLILQRLIEELKAADPESYQILMVLADGLSERAGAAELGIPRNTFVYKRDRLLKKLRENF